ncbi:MAG: glutaminyl-peptide cyclotransferase [Pseudodesulfovibrio sp.]
MHRTVPRLLAALLLALALGSIAAPRPAMAQAPVRPCRVVAEFPHDPKAFTEGLFIENGRLYESSGGYGTSYVAEVDRGTGRPLLRRDVEPRYFAEGIAPYGDTLRLVTWRSGEGFILALDTLAPKGTFASRAPDERTEAWGLAFDGSRFILSSGTDRLHFHQPEDFSPMGEIRVRDGDRAVPLLNELECVEGMILANLWKRDEIAVIDPADGTVTARIDLAPLRARVGADAGVANGIAYDRETGRLFVTGKHWDKLFEIEPDLDAWQRRGKDRE